MRKIVIAVAILAAVMALAIAHGQHQKQRMDEYASANNCTWVMSDYIDRDPVCR